LRHFHDKLDLEFVIIIRISELILKRIWINTD
jgi:hypothetical protein